MAEAADDKKLAPIIKKVKKGGHGGHHGGAWKVAYADFVTAMMAFFLLLWLLATTTPEQRQGIAEYFTPTVGLKDSKGIGFEGGLTPNEKGSSRTTMTTPGLVQGQVQQGPQPKPPSESSDITSPNEESTGGALPMPEGGEAESEGEEGKEGKTKQSSPAKDDQDKMKKVEEEINSTFEQSPELVQLRKHVLITNTPEGLKIDVMDLPNRPLFLDGTATMTDAGRLMFKGLSGVILHTRNQISLTGHTESVPYPAGALYTGWELSADRANATRRYMTENLLEPQRIAKVAGMADKELLMAKQPQSPRNRRITLMLLRNALMVDPKDAPAGKDLLSVPEVDTKSLRPPPPPPAPAPAKPAEETPSAPPAAPLPPEGPVDLQETPADTIFAPESLPGRQGSARPAGALAPAAGRFD